MKNLKKSLPFLLFSVGITVAVMFSGFLLNNPTHYQYMSRSTNEADIKNIDNWEPIEAGIPDCGKSGRLVCVYAFNGDRTDFQNFLELSSTTADLINHTAKSTKQ